jgi:hypothetical protein
LGRSRTCRASTRRLARRMTPPTAQLSRSRPLRAAAANSAPPSVVTAHSASPPSKTRRQLGRIGYLLKSRVTDVGEFVDTLPRIANVGFGR